MSVYPTHIMSPPQQTNVDERLIMASAQQAKLDERIRL